MFRDRRDGGQQLAERLVGAGLEDPVVLALPRGGVPVAYEVALRLDAPLEVFVARKIGAPGRPELGIGAIAEGGARVVDPRATKALYVADDELEAMIADEQAELDRRVHAYRGERAVPELEGRTVVLVDDGLATGVTARAALAALRRRHPARLVLGIPVCAPQAAHAIAAEHVEVVCVLSPSGFHAVGSWYQVFDQTSDDEVVAILEAAQRLHPTGAGRRSRH
jgi:putative phosphoribosyl transferase